MPEHHTLILYEFGDYQRLPAHINLTEFKAYLREVWENRHLFYESPLKEHTTTEEQEADIRRQGQALLKFDGYEVQARNYVGFIYYQGVTIHLLPKIFKSTGFSSNRIFEHLLFYLSYCSINRFPFAQQSLDVSGHASLVQIFVHLFAAFTEKTLSGQPLQAYEEVNHPTAFMQGKLQIPEYIRHNLSSGQWQQLQIRHTPLQYNNKFNQIVKYTISRLLPLASGKTLPLLESVLFMLHEVSEQTFTYMDCEKEVINRLYEDHQQILHMCRFFLANESLAPPNQSGSHFSFLVPMEQVFETFVTGFIRQHFPHFHLHIQSASYLATLQGANMFQMRNDIWLPDTAVIIDMKYKLLESEPENVKINIAQTDLYQMLAYAIRRKATHVHLIYPRVKDNIPEPLILEIEEALGEKPVYIHVHEISMLAPDMLHTVAELLVPKLKEELGGIIMSP